MRATASRRSSTVQPALRSPGEECPQRPPAVAERRGPLPHLHLAGGADDVPQPGRQCLQLYYYFRDRELGLIHVKLQSWFPFQMQIYLNGHERTARFSRSCSPVSTPSTDSPTATSEQDSGELRSLSPYSHAVNTERARERARAPLSSTNRSWKGLILGPASKTSSSSGSSAG